LLTLGAAAFALPVLGMVVPVRAHASPIIPENIDFRVLYHGASVGEHKVAFHMQGDSLVVTTHIDILVKVWFLTAFRYAHDSVEVWHAGRLVSVESATTDDGVVSSVSGQAVRKGFRISSADGPFLAAPALLTSNTLWDRRLMQESMVIDVQHGGVTGLVVKRLGEERVETPRGAVNATHFQILTPLYAGSLFFDGDGRWIKGLIERQGEVLEYVLNA
jgi:hypothetical protein